MSGRAQVRESELHRRWYSTAGIRGRQWHSGESFGSSVVVVPVPPAAGAVVFLVIADIVLRVAAARAAVVLVVILVVVSVPSVSAAGRPVQAEFLLRRFDEFL